MNIGSLIDDEKIKIKNSDRCCYCGTVAPLTIDHLIPQAKGGAHSGDNSVWACQSCNSSKGKKDLLDWLEQKGKFPALFLLRRYLKIARVFFCIKIGKKIIMLHSFIKKSQKTPKKELKIAKSRMSEVIEDETF